MELNIPHFTLHTNKRGELDKKMINIKNITFYRSFAIYESIPTLPLKEFIFLGRSNVGKSSLINNLTNSNIAKVSQTPGKTQLINFFNVDNKFYLVDLPGYGYAKIDKEKREIWSKEIVNYINNRENIEILFLLLDIRRIPSDDDKEILSMIRNKGKKVIYILTKTDKLSSNQIEKQKGLISTELFINQMDMIFYSTIKKIGRDTVLKELNNFFISSK